MRILLAIHAQYFPAHGGGEKSNRLLMEALSERGHDCRVTARADAEDYPALLASREVACETGPDGDVGFRLAGVDVRAVADSRLRPLLASQIDSFQPEIIITSTDDHAHLLLDAALRAPGARVFVLARATLALPFGPDCAFPSEAKTARLRAADRVVGVSQYVADYCCRYGAIDAVHVPISFMEREDWPELGRLENEFVTLVNPCGVKGISVFLALADSFPGIRFAAVPTWGTNVEDRAALRLRPNVVLLDPVDKIDDLLARTRVLLVPSLWPEARSRIVVEAMLRGVPVIASNVGGIPEAKLGVPYLLPVNPIRSYRGSLDDRNQPVPDIPPQDVAPWRAALVGLLNEPAHYREIAQASRAAAVAWASNLSVEPFERLLEGALSRPRRATSPVPRASAGELSPEKRRLLALRLRKRAPASAWFPGIDSVPAPRLFWFPHAGGGSGAGRAVGFPHVPVRLPGRESRIAESPFERMEPLVEALAAAIEPFLGEPFAFFGHSMGAVVAFELARLLRKRGCPLPSVLIASAARAPRYRRNHVPPPAPSDQQLMEELVRLQGMPPGALDEPAFRHAVLPALRADTALYRAYVYAEEAPLSCRICAYGGVADPNITREHLEAWAAETAAAFRLRLFPGGHFYLEGSAAEVRAALEEDCS